MRIILTLALIAPVAGTLTKLATFDNARATTYKWTDTNDPVMGGRSVSTFAVDSNNKVGVFNGTCAIVPSLKAPGFCKVNSNTGAFADVSTHLNGHLELRVRSSTPKFSGFRVAFGAKDVPRSSIFTSGTFKAPFTLQDTTEFQIVKVPFNTFSWDWSSFTGSCNTKDPTGKQHYCCSDDAKYCPTAAFLSTISSLEIWAEGAEGDFHLELDYIGADDSTTAPAGKTIVDGAGEEIVLVDFKGDGSSTSHTWRANNDPVMGGRSTSTVTVENNVLNFTGTCAIVPSLKAPGFITAVNSDKNAWVDVSSCEGLKIKHKSDNNYAGFRLSFGRAHPVGGKFFAYGYKAHFNPSVGAFGDATLPFNSFTDFWDDATGEPIHTCADNKNYCPDAKTLVNVGTMSFWAEGVEGDIHLEIDSVRGYNCK